MAGILFYLFEVKEEKTVIAEMCNILAIVTFFN